jgi:hypothetical protein
MFILANAPISWRVGSQDRIALSTCESEVRAIHAMKEAVKQAMWYNKICCELGLKTENKSLLNIHEDNKACIAYNCNLIRHSTIKHLERELYWIQEAVARGEIKLIATPTKIQWTNIGTKPLGPKVLHYIRSNIMH